VCRTRLIHHLPVFGGPTLWAPSRQGLGVLLCTALVLVNAFSRSACSDCDDLPVGPLFWHEAVFCDFNILY
jgi:hypothetical protein